LAVAAENGGPQPNPAGLLGSLAVRFKGGQPLVLQTDGRWQSAATVGEDWLTNHAPEPGWGPALELGPYGMPPWNGVVEPAAFPEVYPDYALVEGLLANMGVPPDFEADPFLRYTHRRDGQVDIYFLANPEARPLQATATFRVGGRQPELWDAVTGEQRELPQFAARAGRTVAPLRFEPHQSFFIVFRKAAQGRRASATNFAQSRPLQEVSGPWDVAFQPHRGAPERVRFQALADWSKHPDPGVKHFSGIATYRTQFESRARHARVFLELGDVQVLASVKLNGRDLGTVWTAPFRVEATKALEPGANRLEIRVANLWPNRLIGDAGLPPDQRVAWTTWNPFKKDSPLLPSGLLGPVRLVAEE
jgi:hypothetical protein